MHTPTGKIKFICPEYELIARHKKSRNDGQIMSCVNRKMSYFITINRLPFAILSFVKLFLRFILIVFISCIYLIYLRVDFTINEPLPNRANPPHIIRP